MNWLDRKLLDSLRTSEPDHYAASFFFPSPHRDALLVLLAFHQEIRKIPDIVSEPMLGEIRLQWWRDAIQSQDATTGNPLADGLKQVITDYQLPLKNIHEMIDARSFDLGDERLTDVSALKIYIRKTTGAYFNLAGLVASEGTDAPDPDIIHHAALSYGTAKILQELPQSVSRGRIYVPQSLLDDCGVDVEEIWKGNDTPELRDALEELKLTALSSYKSFKSLIKVATPSKFSPAFLPVTLVELMINRTGRSKQRLLRDYNPNNPLRRLWRYWLAAAFGVC